MEFLLPFACWCLETRKLKSQREKLDSIPSPGSSSSSAAFFFFYPTSFPKGIILVATVTGRRQRENSFVVLFDSAAVSLRQNSLDQFFFFGKLSFSWLEWLQNSFSKGERADGHPFLFSHSKSCFCMRDVSSEGKICISCQMNQC